MRKLRSRGAALTDYGLLVGLVAVGAIASVATTGDEVVRAFCKASNGMLQITGGEPQAWCIEDPNDRVQLAEDERFVDAPVQMQADFTDVLFANSVIGDQLVMSAFQEAPAKSFWLDTELTSRDPHEADRKISSCYILNGGADPICATPGSTSAVSVPVEAKAFGYAVTLSEDTEMPWANDVEISIPASEGMEAQSWNVEVAREEAEPILDNFAVAFGSHVFEQTDTGWTYGAFAPIEGKFNRPFSFHMQSSTDIDRERRACYVPSEGAEPICSLPHAEHRQIELTVAPGAVALGYEIELPAMAIGPDWVVSEYVNLVQDGTALHSEGITMTRPNEAYKNGSMARSFSSPYSFAQTDNGWTEGEFIEISGPRNVNLAMEFREWDNNSYSRKACYKTVAGGEPICGDPQHYYTAKVTVPKDAVEVGYMISLPSERVGPDTTFKNKLTLSGGGGVFYEDILQIVRPNEPYQSGQMTASFSSPYSFAQTDTGWTEGEFVELNGPRNVNLTMKFQKWDNNSYSRKACYKTVAGGEPVCGDPQYYYAAEVTVPTDAVEVGYMLSLPAERVGPDTTFENKLTLSGGNNTLYEGVMQFVRPNEPYEAGTMAQGFSTNYSFAQTDTDWTEGEFVAIGGERNVNTLLEVDATSEGGYLYREACYKLVAGGAPTCGEPEFYGDAKVYVPVEAVEIGYRVKLPSEAVGPDGSWKFLVDYGHSSKGMFRDYVTIKRPNEPYEAGTMAQGFSTNYSFAQTDTDWTEGEFVAIGGERNINTLLEVDATSEGGRLYREACYKLVAGGAPTCGEPEFYGDAKVYVPVEAVEIGYRVKLPAEGVGPDGSWKFLVDYGHSSKGMFRDYVTIKRPNEPYQTGAMDQPFASTYNFAGSDTEWTEGEFVGISGDRNVNLTLNVKRPTSGREVYRQACYKTVVGGAPICGAEEYWGHATVSVPPEAVEVGYMLKLPAVWASEWSSRFYVEYRHSQYLFNGYVNAVRPAGS